MSLRAKFAFAFMAVAAMTVLVSAAGFLRFQDAAFEAERKENARNLLNDIGRAAEEAEFADDPLLLVDHLRFLLKTREDVAWFRVRRKAGLAPVFLKAAGPGVDVRVERRAYGKVRVDAAFSKPYLEARRARARERALRGLWRGIGLVAPATLVVAVVLAMLLSGRLLKLGRAVDEISGGRFEVRTRVGGSDEIGKLARRIDAMAARLGELDEMKKTFVASVTHELRSPLAAVESAVKLLLSRPGAREETETELLQRVQASAARLGRFVANMLEMAKIERGKLEFRPRWARLQDIAKDVVVLFEPRALESGVRLSVSTDDGRPPGFRLDPDLVTQAISNLVSNALKFTPREGAVELDVRQVSTDGAAWAECGVRDTGAGIPAEARARLFVPFERISSGVRAGGAGLGLAISKAIVQMHGGAIGVESSPGRGSRFWFRLPMK